MLVYLRTEFKDENGDVYIVEYDDETFMAQILTESELENRKVQHQDCIKEIDNKLNKIRGR